MPCDCGETALLNGHCRTPGCPNTLPPRTVSAVVANKPRKPLSKKSARKRREEKETKPIREIKSGEKCELCHDLATETHEIAGGSARHNSVYDRRGQIRVCRSCHETIQGIPCELQIALKVDAMIAAINEAWGCVKVSSEDVRKAL